MITSEIATAIVSAPNRGGIVRSTFGGTLCKGRPVAGLVSVTVDAGDPDPGELMNRPPRAKEGIPPRIGRPNPELRP
jgi:hypothetical protein